MAAAYAAVVQGRGDGLVLRHDHGSQFESSHLQAELRFLGIAPLPAFLREAEGTGCRERFIRTPQEQLLWSETFKTVDELPATLDAFLCRTNQGSLVEKHGFKTPAATAEALTSGLGRAAR